MSNTEPGAGIALDTSPVHFAASGSACTIDGFTFDPPGFEAYIAANTSPTDPGRLVFVERYLSRGACGSATAAATRW
jgi:hypothetical protein